MPRDEEVDVTLRITREESSHRRTRLLLEGSVVGEWTTLLEQECSRLLRSSIAVSIDLTGVGIVDRAAVETLERLSRAGVEIRCRPSAVASVLEGEGIRVTRDASGEDDRRR